MKFTYKLFILHVISTIALISAIIWSGAIDWTITAIVYCVVAISLTVTYHRYLAHRSFEFRWNWLRNLFITICTVGSGFGSPFAWVAIHREHHRHSDTVLDPHLGNRLSNLPHIHLTSMFLEPKIKYATDIARDSWCRMLHNHYFLLHCLWAITLLVIDPWLVISAYLVPLCLLWHSGNLVNSISHLWGYKNYPDNGGRNNWFVALVFFGEWHNNHHKFPLRAKHGVKWWEFDPAYWLIRLVGRKVII
jgi:stearoyl-CoA desaturase (delta-9 desaturase)